jgi:multiple sugar transport system permease protein
MCVFILANFFREIPNAYDEAARMDGASHLMIMWRIITPMSLPAVASIAILNFTWTWNYYLWPLIIATTDTMYTLPVGLATLAGSETNIRYGPIMAANIMASIPVIVLFIIFQKNLMQGVSAGSGVK